MKEIKEKGSMCLKIMILGATVYFCIAEANAVKSAVKDGIDRCLTVVIPSLYAMMIAAVMIIGSGILGCIPKFIKKLGRVFFGMPGESFPVFVFSMFAGYPAGSKMIKEQYSSGIISKRTASVLCGVCFGAGPAFVTGCISGELYSSGIAGKLIMISTVSANILTALIVSPFLRKEELSGKCFGSRTKLHGDVILTKSVVSAGRTMAELCFMITAFSVITAILKEYGIISAAASVFSGLTGFSPEISNAFIPALLDITTVRGLCDNNYALLPWLCALVSFGGICVLFQTAAIISGSFSLRIFLVLRLAASAASFWICRLIMPFMLKDETIAAAAVNVGVHSAPSPVPSVMLLLMTFMIIAEYDKLVKIQK